MFCAKDYHKVLGLRKGASRKEIQEAYRRLALAYHPDRNKDAGAEERFKEISEAYAVLSGKERPPPEPAQAPQMDADAAWAYRVMALWQRMEEEKHNNMYR